jgi:hypothetical protein
MFATSRRNCPLWSRCSSDSWLRLSRLCLAGAGTVLHAESPQLIGLIFFQVSRLCRGLVQVCIACQLHVSLTFACSFFFFEETIFSTSIWQRRASNKKTKRPLSLSHHINNLVRDEYLRLYNSPSSRMLFPEKAVQVLACAFPPPCRMKLLQLTGAH